MSLELRNVQVRRRGRTILAGVNLAFKPSLTCVMGVNGAGKSTLLSVIAGLTSYTGTILADGKVVNPRHRSWLDKDLGYAPQNVSWPSRMRVHEVCELAAYLRRVPEPEISAGVRRALDIGGLADLADQRVGALSGGQRRRLTLAQALVHRPALLVLDEPTSELDPAFTQDFANTVRLLRDEHTLLISTHSIDDAANWGGDLVMLDRGQVRYIPDECVGSTVAHRAETVRSLFRELATSGT